MLVGIGCESGQGYLYARALSELEALQTAQAALNGQRLQPMPAAA